MSASDSENANQKRHKQTKQGSMQTIDIHTAIDSLDKKEKRVTKSTQARRENVPFNLI